MRRALFAVIVLMVCSCQLHREPMFVRLRDGRTFPVKALGRVILGGNLGHPPIIQLQYVTTTKIEDSPELRAEALAVFQAWQSQLEKEGVRYAVVGATSVPDSSGTTHMRNFIFERDPGGPWHGKLLGNERPDRD